MDMDSVTKTDRSSNLSLMRAQEGPRLGNLCDRFEWIVPGLLDGFFTVAEDFLFKQAEKNTLDASDYFDQLRVLRRRKTALRQSILTEFTDWLSSGAAAVEDATYERPKTLDKLALMDDLSLDRTLAVDSFMNRTLAYSGEHWLAFQQRLQIVTGQKALRDKDTPFNPGALGTIILRQLETLGAPFRTTLMLFRLFDDLAIAKLSGFYQDSNAWLKEQGVLPNLRLAPSNTQPAAPVKEETITRISEQLAGLAQSNAAHHDMSPAMPSGGRTGPGIMIDAHVWQQMVQVMVGLQAQVAPAPQQQSELKQWTSQQAKSIEKQAAGTLEAGTISLVATLFEYILDDDNLSAHMKQLLARMQIPVIKVAILDKTFFTDADHCARRLLNKMALAATGWTPNAEIDHDVLLDGMEDIVTELNHQFEDDLTIFDHMLDKLADLVHRHDQQQNERLDTIRLSEEKEFASHQAQNRAGSYLERLLEGDDELPELVRTTLLTYWYRLMNSLFDRKDDSKAWKTSARIARELIWSMQPSVQITHARRFEKIVPQLLKGFAQGLKTAGMPAEQIQQVMQVIRNHHVNHERVLDESIWDAQEKLSRFEAQSEQADVIVAQPDALPIDEPKVDLKTADLSDYVDRVEAMTEGVWFDIEKSDGSIVRGQLSMIIGSGSKYVFTDFQGRKVAERSTIGLAMGMRNEQFRLLDDQPLVDRMIHTLVDELG